MVGVRWSFMAARPHYTPVDMFWIRTVQRAFLVVVVDTRIFSAHTPSLIGFGHFGHSFDPLKLAHDVGNV
jgi:hypothetical protein